MSKTYDTTRKLNRHLQRYHTSTRVPTSDVGDEDYFSNDAFNSDALTMDAETRPEGFHGLLADQNYDFEKVVKLMLLTVSRQERNISHSAISDVSQGSFVLLSRLSALVYNMNSDQRCLLNIVLQQLAPTLYDSKSKHALQLTIPLSMKKMNSMILSPRNYLSYRSLLPVPQVILLDDKRHAYISYLDMIKHMAMTSTDDDYRAVKQRQRALLDSDEFRQYEMEVNKIQDTKRKVIVLLIMWSDGFDPNAKKTNRGSVWALTGSYLFYDCEKKDAYMFKTGVVSTGHDKDDHSVLFRKILEEKNSSAEALSAPSHYHSLPGEVSFYPKILGALMDNPERRGNFGLLSGTSNNHGMFGLNCHFDQLEKPFEPCTDCLSKIDSYIETANWTNRCLPVGCQKCLANSVPRLLQEGKYRQPLFHPPDVPDHPSSEIPGIHLNTGPGHLTNSLLKEGWHYAIERFDEGHWDCGTTRDYCKMILCYNAKTINKLIEAVRECNFYQEYTEDPSELKPDKAKEIQSNLEKDSHHYSTLKVANPIWDLLDIMRCWETVMHNHQNSGKAVWDFITTWTSSIGKTKSLVETAQIPILKVQKLRSEFYKAMTFNTDKLGSYVAENWRTLIAISPWALRFLVDYKSAPIELPPDDLVPSKWRKNHNIAYLYSQGITRADDGDGVNIADLPAKELKQKVRRVLNDINAGLRNALVLELDESGCTDVFGPTVLKMLGRLSDYFTCLMDGELTGAVARNRAEALGMSFMGHSYHFLSNFSSTPAEDIRKKCTMISLLRTPSHMLHLSSLKSIHEGGTMGEGLVKKLRQFVGHGLKPGWCVHVLENFYRDESTRFINSFFSAGGDLKSCGHEDGEETLEIEIEHHRNYSQYKSKQNFIEVVAGGGAISLVMLKKRRLGFVTKDDKVHPLVLRDPVKDPNGFTYFTIATSSTDNGLGIHNKSKMTLEMGYTVVSYAIGLPMYWGRSSDHSQYAILTQDGASYTTASQINVIR